MADRPAMPAELRRQILTEAGHRCAIHTCRHVNVDVHHIVPWVQVLEHRFENLIALCPNCHRRAEAGEIDRKSLRIYKARLAAAFRFDGLNQYPEERIPPVSVAWSDPTGHWYPRQTIRDEGPLELGVEYPQFRGYLLGGSTAAVNRHIRDRMDGLIAEFELESSKLERRFTDQIYQLHSSFSVTMVRSEIVSFRLRFTSYTGGAHSGHWTEVFNLLTGPVQEFGVEQLFADFESGLDVTSRYVIEQLLATPEDRPPRDPSWVHLGAGPEAKNFRTFNITDRGILLTFDEYQVGGYAEGASEVHVPYELLAPHLAADMARLMSRVSAEF